MILWMAAPSILNAQATPCSLPLAPCFGFIKSRIFAGLKRFLSISLLSIFLVSATELYQLVKLPLMVEHFKEHRQEDKDITLWAFLCMHYDYAAKPDEDYAKDMTLPFKANDSMINATIADFVPTTFYISPAKKTYASSVQFVTFDEQHISSSFLSNIWQPPKSC